MSYFCFSVKDGQVILQLITDNNDHILSNQGETNELEEFKDINIQGKT